MWGTFGYGDTDLAGGIWHRAHHFSRRQDHCLKLRDCRPRENTDEELAFEGFLHPGLAQDRTGELRLAAVKEDSFIEFDGRMQRPISPQQDDIGLADCLHIPRLDDLDTPA